uniref:Uncharacterized protein n=1 Tax=Caenorhabditis japonica TaxID=281687 RepID=A0A8R1EPP2_CAEJA
MVEREEEKRNRDKEIQKAEKEQDELKKKQREDAEKHKKELNDMSKQHRNDVDEHFEKMSKMMQDQTSAAIKRIAEETTQRLQIVDASYDRVKKDAIESMYINFFNEYNALMLRGEDVQTALTDLCAVIDPGKDEFPYAIRDLHSEYNTDAALMDKQLSLLKQRMKTCFHISDEFKGELMKPLEHYEKSRNSVKNNGIQILMAAQVNMYTKVKSQQKQL